jgi:hypothetical protein
MNETSAARQIGAGTQMGIPSSRLNNTASSSFIIASAPVFEEEKKCDEPTPTPIEECK